LADRTISLIERFNLNAVEGVMKQARAILVSLIPALVLLASMDGFGNPSSSGACLALSCLQSEDGHSNHNQPPHDNSFAQAIQRSGRRSNVQPGPDAAPVPLPLSLSFLPDLVAARSALPLADIGLAQCWQFQWRTALEPRAPSFVS
jgi:hypothetical protein